MKGKALIFLNGTYPAESIDFYIDQYRNGGSNAAIIAVDGALNFFYRHGLKPDVIIGDNDSSTPSLREKFPGIQAETTQYQNYTFTDGELALIWCVDHKIEDVTLYGGIDTAFETDHLLGNIFMMFAFMEQLNSIKMLDPLQEIYPLFNSRFSGEGNQGDIISVIPVRGPIKFKASGLKYNPDGQIFEFGSTTPLRNQLTGKHFEIHMEGMAILVRHLYAGL